MKKLVIEVDGMVCNGCENRLENVLLQIDGVQKVVANHINGTVIITSKNDILPAVIKKKIADIGFSLKEN